MPRSIAAAMHVVVLAVVVTLVANGAASATDSPPAKAPAKKAAAKKAPKAKDSPKTGLDAVKEIVEGEDVRDFRAFCDSWMQKLRERDTYNVAHIAWKTQDGRVSGEYVSYGTDRTCSAREEPGKDPIGKITYREILNRREGATQAAAMAAAGTIVEQTDVTEIFRYAKGRWLY